MNIKLIAACKKSLVLISNTKLGPDWTVVGEGVSNAIGEGIGDAVGNGVSDVSGLPFSASVRAYSYN